MKDGKERGTRRSATSNRFYYASTAPVVMKNQIIAGVSGDDMDNPGYVQATTRSAAR